MIKSDRKTSLWLLATFCALPAIQTVVSVYWQWHMAVTYPAFKALMIAIPILVWLKSRRSGREVLETVGWKRTNLRFGLFMGGLMAVVILVGYYILLRSVIDPAPVLAKISAMGLVEYYWAMALVTSLWNSLFEEYYWRAFIVSELRSRLQKTTVICLICGLLFGPHHVFALMGIFNWPLVVLCTFGAMVAGGVWSWMRLSGRSIIDCYVSHVLADLAIMWIGYDLILRAQ